MNVFAKEVWGSPPKIIIGIDIGTTESAVTFAHLYPGGPQSLQRVSAWPGQEAQWGHNKIPTLVYYDSRKKATSFGAEALSPEIVERAEDEHWQLARYFKLHLQPNASRKRYTDIEPLPMGVSLLTIYTDFIGYLLKHTKDFFENRIIDGLMVWRELNQNMTIVFTHPNGWGLKEQNFLRQAALAAHRFQSPKGHPQIEFVTEGVSSIHFLMFHGGLHDWLKLNSTFVLCDTGKLSTNTTLYCVNSISPLLELEQKSTARLQAGGIFVDREFEQHLAKLLGRVNDLDEEDRKEYLRKGVRDFEAFAKRTFHTVEREYRVDLGAGRLQRNDVGISKGTLALEGSAIKGFFDQSVTQIIEGVRKQILESRCKQILLIGKFGENLYLRKSLIDEFGSDGCTVRVANDSTPKAVADGAVIWCGKRSLISGATRISYGVDINIPYNPSLPSHQGRRIYRHAAGYDYLINGWSLLIAKGADVDIGIPIREIYWCSYRTPNPHLDVFKLTLFAYTGAGTPGDWLRDSNGNLNEGFGEVCKIEVDLNAMRKALKRRTGQDGDFYYLIFTILFKFGRTELEATVEWEQLGEFLTMPTRITPSPLLC